MRQIVRPTESLLGVIGAFVALSLGVSPEADAKPKSPAPAANPVVELTDGALLFTSTRDGGDRDVFIANRDGSSPRNLTSGSPAEDYDPFLREDGDLIFFTSTRDGGDADIFVMNANGSDPRNLTASSTATDEAPTVTGHVRRVLYFASDRDGDFDVWRSDIHGNQLQNMTDEGPGDPATNERAPWGEEPSFGDEQFLGATDRAGGDGDIFENSPTFLKTELSGLNETEPGGFIRFTPNYPGQPRLIFQGDRDGSEDVFSYLEHPQPGDQLENLTPGSLAFDGEPARSPTANQIAFTSAREGDRDVWVMNADGSSPVNLTPESGAIEEDPSWSYRYICDGHAVTVLGAWARANKAPNGTRRDDVIFFGYYNPPRYRPSGGRGDDVMCASYRVGRQWGGRGNDRILGFDQLKGAAPRNPQDVLYGEKGSDEVLGLGGADFLYGGEGKDLILGGLGKDVLRGGPGRDLLHGGPGSDWCIGDPRIDRFRSCEHRE